MRWGGSSSLSRSLVTCLGRLTQSCDSTVTFYDQLLYCIYLLFPKQNCKELSFLHYKKLCTSGFFLISQFTQNILSIYHSDHHCHCHCDTLTMKAIYVSAYICRALALRLICISKASFKPPRRLPVRS